MLFLVRSTLTSKYYLSYHHNLLHNTLDDCTIIAINFFLNHCTNTYIWYIFWPKHKKYGNLFFSSFIIFHCRAFYLRSLVLWCFYNFIQVWAIFNTYRWEELWNWILKFCSIQFSLYLKLPIIFENYIN